MRAERCLSARHEARRMAAGVGAAGASARCDRAEVLVHLLQEHELVQWLPLAPLVGCFVREVMAALLPSVACSEEVVPPSNAFHLAPPCEEVSWNFMQPAVRIHDQ